MSKLDVMMLLLALGLLIYILFGCGPLVIEKQVETERKTEQGYEGLYCHVHTFPNPNESHKHKLNIRNGDRSLDYESSKKSHKRHHHCHINNDPVIYD